MTRNYNILFTVLTISITSIFIFNTYVDYFDNNSIIYDSNGNEVSGVIDFMNRNDTYIGFLAFLDKPLGHGYDKQTNKYYKFALDNGLLPSYTEFKNRIPTHSTIVGNAVSGVLASLCWLYFYFLLIRWFIFVVNKGVNSDFSIVIILIVLYCLNLFFALICYIHSIHHHFYLFFLIKTSLNIKKYKN